MSITASPIKSLFGLLLLILNISACAGNTMHDFLNKTDLEKLSLSDVRENEELIFFRTAARLDNASQTWHIPVHAWVYQKENSRLRKASIEKILERKYDLKVSEETQSNFDERVNLLLSDNERNREVSIEIAGQIYQLPKSKPNGHTQANISISVETVNQYRAKNTLKIVAIGKDNESKFSGEVLLIEPEGISVISDIDDTVKISHVMEHKSLFDYAFFKDFVAVPDIATAYNKLSENNISIHFVSSSPWYLYSPLNRFFEENDFPKATLSLKDIRFRDSTLLNLFKKGTQTKPAQIEPILKAYPNRKFILVGDSGEQDPEVYTSIFKKYSDQIIHIYIRNVSDENIENPRFSILTSELKPGVMSLIDNASLIIK